MEKNHKELLQRNRTKLVTDLDPSVLYDGLLEKGVFTPDMIDEIKSSGTRRDQARQLLRDLETRGSRAFPLFVQTLQESGHHGLVEVLMNATTTPQLQPSEPPQRPTVQPLPVYSPMDVDKQPKVAPPVYPVERPRTTPTPSPDQEHKPSPQGRPRRDNIQSYKMDAAPCGHCLIINNVEFDPKSNLSNRKGSNVDCVKLERRFKAFGFIVDVKTDLTQKQIKHAMSVLCKKDHSQYDCCVVIMLSHGTEANHNRFPGAVYGVDGEFVLVQNIINYLNGKHCPSLQGKPKLFFIQACGGDERDVGSEVSPEGVQSSVGGTDDQTDAIPTSSSSDSLSTSDEVDAKATLPTFGDLLVSYSTFPGYASWRDTQYGSWYVKTLDRILEENASSVDLGTMLTMVNNEVSQYCARGVYKQAPGFVNYLGKQLYFQSPA